jgi:hypothetical protein
VQPVVRPEQRQEFLRLLPRQHTRHEPHCQRIRIHRRKGLDVFRPPRAKDQSWCAHAHEYLPAALEGHHSIGHLKQLFPDIDLGKTYLLL